MTENTPGKGHNSEVGGIAADRLTSFVERIERLNEEKDALTADIREVYSEAKSSGFDVKTIRKVIQRRKLDAMDREFADELQHLYEKALGMFG